MELPVTLTTQHCTQEHIHTMKHIILHLYQYMYYMYMYMYMSCMVYVHVHVLCCFALFVCLILLASFFLPSHLSFKNMYIGWVTISFRSVCYMYMYFHVV